MNKIVHKTFQAGDQFRPELYLRQSGFTYSACGPFTKHPKRIQNFEQTSGLKHIYKNELDKACFVHNAAYSDNKDLAKITIQIIFWKIELMKLL